MSEMNRRSFLVRGAAVTGSTVLASTLLSTLGVAAAAKPPPLSDVDRGDWYTGGYGPLQPVAAANEPGVAYFALPAGFSYVVLGRTGTPMVSDPSLLNPR